MPTTKFSRELQAYRRRCRYPRTGDLAERTGVTTRALEYFEAGAKIPKRSTLDTILTVTGATREEAALLHRLRDGAVAARQNLQLNDGRGLAVDTLVARLVVEAAVMLRKIGIEISKDTQAALATRFERTIVAELPGSSTGPPA